MGNLATAAAWPAPAPAGPVRAAVRVPGSKSMTARALVLAALADRPSQLSRPLRARDTTLMADGLRALGTEVVAADPDRWVVRPGPLAGPARVYVGLAGTVMRFLPAVAGLATGPTTFDGDARARERPLRPLLAALAAAGVGVDSATGGLPLTVRGAGAVAGGPVTLDASSSSQLVSGLLLAAPRFDRGVEARHQGPPVPSRPHLRMTVQMLRSAGAEVDDATPDRWQVAPGRLRGRAWEIEPDLSTAAPFLAAALVTGGEVTVADWPEPTVQAGDRLRELLTRLGGDCRLTAAGLTVRGTGTVHGIDADLSDVSELAPVVAALCALADGPSRLTGIGHVRGHETDRLAALAAELTALGAGVTEAADGLAIRPAPLRPTTFDPRGDHRLAHAAAVLGLAVQGVQVADIACTTKTLPDFPDRWAALAATGGA